jgi:hypothetical protein
MEEGFLVELKAAHLTLSVHERVYVENTVRLLRVPLNGV